MVANIPNKLFDSSAKKITNLSADDLKNLNQWASKKSGQLLLVGKPGRGKTCCSIALMRFFDREGIALTDQHYYFVPDLFEIWKSQMHENWKNYDLLTKLKEFRVLVLDDMGSKEPSPSFLDFLYVVINHRCLGDDITIYTSNLNSKEMNDSFGGRIVSRISEGLILKFEGEDLRQVEF